LAELTGDNIPIAQELLRRKLQAQLATIVSHPDLPGAPRAQEILQAALAWLALPELPTWLGSVDMVRIYEGRTAAVYFAAWDGWPLRWSKAEITRVPPHWLVARTRNSPLAPAGNARHAVDPLNAVLNYAYALLEATCRQVLSRLGFDLACGFLHTDKPNRESLVYDLMECARGTVDGLVLDFLGQQTLHAGDLIRATDGSCRLHPQLARAVVASCRIGERQVESHARWLREVLSLARKEAASPL
jgi:CRISPR-associated endonuclease Cas1